MRTQTINRKADPNNEGDLGPDRATGTNDDELMIVTQRDGRMIFTVFGDHDGDDAEEDSTPHQEHTPGLYGEEDYGIVPQALNAAIQAFENSDAPIRQDIADGYGAWLEDSFFIIATLRSEDESKRNDPDA